MTDDQSNDDADDAKISEKSASPKLPKIISFEDLARCGNEIWIENNGEIYRLRRTKNGNLIMTK